MGGEGTSKGDGSSDGGTFGAPRDGACCRYAQFGACCCCLPVFGWCYLYSKVTFVKSNEIALAEIEHVRRPRLRAPRGAASY